MSSSPQNAKPQNTKSQSIKSQNTKPRSIKPQNAEPNLRGLTDAEATESRAAHGANILDEKPKPSLFKKVLHLFSEPMFILLFVAASIYFLLGEVTDGVIMLVFVFFISGIEFFQERKTDKALEALNILSALNVKVARNGKTVVIDSKDIVVGDIVYLSEGDKIPADGIILEQQGLGVNESALTGESAVVYKTREDNSRERFKTNMCYAGCDVTNGSAIIKITTVGKETEYGQIGSALNSIDKEKTPLERQIRQLIVICTVISLTFCAIVVIVNFFYNHVLPLHERIIESILSGVTMAMATIPEEIPVVLTVFLAMGAWRLAKHHALVRNMKAVETLGAVTVLCSDKTGTITQNKMTVQDVFTEDADFVRIAALACQKTPYDPMEIAIQNYVFASNPDDTRALYSCPLLHEYIFNNEDKMMGQVWDFDGAKLLAAKGACENILPLCSLSAPMRAKITQQAETYASLGYRVLALAKRADFQVIPADLKENPLTFVGLIALVDPPRVGAKQSVEACHSAGVRIIMITGDNGDTAKGIARQIGLRNSDEVIAGPELEEMSDADLKERVKTVNIFARVYPNHKMRIVKALQENREVVAMTGDGVNDAPALKKATIGIAMGQRGTNVAKEASDLILMDDNFNTIVDAIANGRTIYNNIRKAIAYVLVVHIPIILASLFVPLFGLPLLLLPVHIVLLELIIDPTSSIIFQRFRPDRDVMLTPPRPLDAPLLNKTIVLRAISQGILIFIAMFGSYFYLIQTGASQELASTFAFTTLVLANVLVVYVLQSSSLALKNLLLDLRDRIIVLIVAAILIVLALIIYLPPLNHLIGTVPLSPLQLLTALALALLATFTFDLTKLKTLLAQKPRRQSTSRAKTR